MNAPQPGPSVRRQRLVRRGLVNQIAAASLVPSAIRVALLRLYGLRIDADASVAPRCFFGGPRITIGTRSTIGVGCIFDNSAPIEIGEGCTLAPEVMLITTTHDITDPRRRNGSAITGTVTIGDGASLGARTLVLAGATIGAGCVIAPGSLVMSDCEPHRAYAGIPARLVAAEPA